MSTWTKRKLSEICDVRDGTHDSPKPALRGFPLVTSKHIVNNKIDISGSYLITEEDYKEVNKRSKVEKFDLLISMIGTVGEIAFIKEEPNFAIKNVGLIKTNDETLGKYLFYYLISPSGKNTLASLLSGSTQKFISLGKLRDFSVAVPPEEIIKRIASVLSAYDDLIENNEKRIKVLEEMAERLYREWFVKFKFTGHEKVKMVDSGTEYGKIPEGWEVKRLGEVVIPQYGYTASAEENSNYPKYLRGTDINKSSFIDWMNVPNCKISEEDFRKYKIRKGDVFIIRMADPGKIGICERDIKAVFASYLMRLNIKSNLTPYYLYYFVISEKYQGFVLGASGGTTRKSINSQQVCAIDVLIPKREILDNFETKASLLRAELTKLIQQNNSISKIRDLLIPQLVTGRRELKS